MNCNVCGTASGFLLSKDGYDLYRCPECALDFVWPQPSQHFLAEEVYSAKSGYQGNKARDLTHLAPTKKQVPLLAYLASRSVGKLLDIGCSSGEFMYLAQKLGYSVTGVELNPRTAAIARENGLTVHVGTLDKSPFKPGEFDVVHMGDLIEHVPDPTMLIRDVAKLLKPGGDIIIVTPNMNCFWAKATYGLYKAFRIPWAAATPPHHLFQFSDTNLTRLLTQNGFAFKKVWFVRCPSFKYELGATHLLKRFKKSRTPLNALLMIWGYACYTLFYGVNRLVEQLPVRRFDMALIATKK